MTVLRRLSAVLIILTGILLMANTALYIQSNEVKMRRYDLSFRATQFMNASAYLTSEVRAFAATGDLVHYQNYWSEVNEWKNRDEGKSKLKEIGITKEEDILLEKMSELSDNLIPYENEAMELAKSGDTQGALAIVYGTFYNEQIATIRQLRNDLRTALDERAAAEIKHINVEFTIINIFTWFLAASVIVIQIIQKRFLHKLAYTDSLTGSLNYFTFRQKMHEGINIRKKGYVIAVDLNDFSIINEVCGIEKGDEIIRSVSDILEKGHDRFAGELVAHIVGDRFVMLLQDDNNESLIKRLENMRAEIVAISEKSDIPYLMPVFGINEVSDTKNSELSYGTASFANRSLKLTNFGKFYAFFDKDMSNLVLRNRQMEDNFETAIRERQFEVWFQPKYSTDTGKFASAEALVRWRGADGNLVKPNDFIPLFEGNGMISQLDEYVFTRVCEKLREWMDSGIDIVPISVNVSRASLMRSDIVKRYISAVNKYNIPKKYIEIELTESAIGGSYNAESILSQFRASGFCVLVDDFGVGYSSLSTLVSASFDGIKIDKSLTDNVTTTAGKRLVRIITDLAHEFKMSVTVEGVETLEQAKIIKELTCNLIQGFYCSRPLIEPDFVSLLKKEKSQEFDF